MIPSDAEKRAVEAAKLLKPCPFCGPQGDAEDKPRVSLGETSIGVFCPSCNTWYEAQKPPSEKYVAALIERWNKPLGVVAAERAAYDRAIEEAAVIARDRMAACVFADLADRVAAIPTPNELYELIVRLKSTPTQPAPVSGDSTRADET